MVVLTPHAGRVEDVSAPRAVDPASFGDRVTFPRLALRYVATGLVTLVVVAVVTAYTSRSIGTEEAIEDAIRATSLVADVAVRPVLTDAAVDGDPAALAALDATVRTHVVRGSLVRVKIWDETGRIFYSDESRLVGERFPLREDELQAFETGEPRAELSDLSDPENRFEERAVQLLEVYQRVQTESGTPLLFETYFRYAGVTEAGRGVWLRFAPAMFGALVLLALLQVPIALALARRLRRVQNQRELLFLRAIEATDTERRRIAGDLHDGVVQDLAGVAFSLGAVSRRGGAGPDAVQVHDAASRVRQAVRSLRSLLVEIYPPNLYDEGLQASLSDLLARLSPRGIVTDLAVEVRVADLTREEIELIYRVGLEGLRNVVEHADAAHVSVTVRREGDDLVMCVVDDGRGIAAGPLPERPGHLGLRALAGLAAGLGASLELVSAPGAGTVLRLTLPPRRQPERIR
jgi:two-component system NarL family sensor kinase